MNPINMNTTEANVTAENAMIPPPTAQATTANEAAGLVFPKIAEHFNAFWEKEAEMTEAPSIQLLDLNEEFWALTVGPLGSPETPTVFVASENQFRRYSKTKGIYEPISESAVTSGILGNLDLCAEFLPRRVQLASFLALKNRQILKSVVDRVRDLLAVEDDDAFFQDRKHLHLAFLNGTLQIDTGNFHASEPGRPVKESLPLKYDPQAKCDIFLGSFQIGRASCRERVYRTV